MVSLWGSKKDGEENGTEDVAGHGSDGGPSSRPTSTRDANERTRLLNDGRDHPPPGGRRGDGYLDPDDPAVSPYNLWTVRALRYFTVLFAMITFVWWVLLLVSLFVSPPGMNTPGSGFTDFAFTTLTFGILLMSLIFFSVPSKAIRFSVLIIAILLLVDMIITLSVKDIRHEEGWVGIVSSVWAVLMAAWVVMSDRVVAWGKHEEEERLTGRAESRRTLKQWVSVFLATFIAIVYIVIVILFTATLILRAMDRGLEPDGTLYEVDSGKYSVHLNCIGEVSKDPKTDKREPTIILESGEVPSEYDFEHWAYAARKNGTISRYCYWDRPGYAWSDNAPSPHSADMAATALSEALAQAGEEGPWISVSAGYGSTVARIWTSRNRGRVTGIMMIDPLHEDLLSRVGGAARGFTLWGYGIIAPLGIRRIGGAIFNSRTSEDRVYGNSVWTTGKFIKAKLQENLVAESLTKSAVASSRGIISQDLPLVVVSSGIKVRSDEEWERKQKDLSKITENLVSWDVVNKAPHQVWDTLGGREVMEKRLGQLVTAAKKYKPTIVIEDDDFEAEAEAEALAVLQASLAAEEDELTDELRA